MKKITNTKKQQRRRQGALDRFKMKPDRLDDKEYVAAKEQELAALRVRLGTT